jgi:hypothetical protein
MALMLWMVSTAIGVVALIGLLMVPGRKRIEDDDDLEGYQRTWKLVVYIMGLVVLGGAAFIILQAVYFNSVESDNLLWARVDIGLFVALGLGVIGYNAYSAKLITKIRAENEAAMYESGEGEAEGAVMTKVVKKAKRTRKEAQTAECPACGEAFTVGDKACGSCGAEFEYEGEVDAAIMTERVEEKKEEAGVGAGAFNCPSCDAENKIGDRNCAGCGAEFDYE